MFCRQVLNKVLVRLVRQQVPGRLGNLRSPADVLWARIFVSFVRFKLVQLFNNKPAISLEGMF